MVDVILKHRHPIGKKEAKKLNEGLFQSHGMEFSFHYGKVESAEADSLLVFIEDGYIFAIKKEDVYFLSLRGLSKYPPDQGWVQVDMGAVPYLCNGADTMSAGINDTANSISEGDIVWIRDENNAKPLAVGVALISGEDMLSSTQGKAIKGIHYLSDPIWNFTFST